MNNNSEINNNLQFYLKEVNFDKSDKDLLKSIEPIVSAVAEVFGKNCEVILHSLEDPSHSVIKIENSHITGREKGAPLTDLAMKTLITASENNSDVVGSYFTKTKDNKLFKSITAMIKNSAGNPIGMLCINIDISAGFSEFIKDFIPDVQPEKDATAEHFFTDVSELVDIALSKLMLEINSKKGLSIREKNLMIITDLYQQGIFDIKGAIAIVASQIGLSKYTIYSYLRSMKDE